MGKGNDDRSWLVRAVPALIVGLALVAMAAGMLVASRAGVTRHPSKQVSFGFFDVLIVYATPTAELVVAGLLTTVSFVILVVGLSLLLRPQTVSQLETRHKSQSLLAGFLATALNPTLLATWTIVVTALHANGLLDGGFREGPLFGAGVVVGVLAWLFVLVLLARLGSPERMSRYRAALGRSVGAILILVSALTFLRLASSDAPSSDPPAQRP